MESFWFESRVRDPLSLTTNLPIPKAPHKRGYRGADNDQETHSNRLGGLKVTTNEHCPLAIGATTKKPQRKGE